MASVGSFLLILFRGYFVSVDAFIKISVLHLRDGETVDSGDGDLNGSENASRFQLTIAMVIILILLNEG